MGGPVPVSPADAPDQKSQASAAFPPEARLRKPADFKRVFARPLVSTDHLFKVLARPNGRGRPRLGMAVSRQVDRKATRRNRVKRMIRESFRRYAREQRPSLDFVVLPRRASATISNRRLTQSLDAHWLRLAEQAAVAQNGAAEKGS